MPRRRHTDEFDSKDWPVASVRLKLTNEDQAELAAISVKLTDVTVAKVTRCYSGQYTVGFDPEPDVASVMKRQALDAVSEAQDRREQQGG
jgi:hypothetical protein